MVGMVDGCGLGQGRVRHRRDEISQATPIGLRHSGIDHNHALETQTLVAWWAWQPVPDREQRSPRRVSGIL